VTWFQAFNPFMIFAFTPFIVAFVALAGPRRAGDRRQDGDRLFPHRPPPYLVMVAAGVGVPVPARRAALAVRYFVIDHVANFIFHRSGSRWSPSSAVASAVDE